MTRTSTIAIGSAFDPGHGPTVLILPPGQTPPDYRPGLKCITADTLPEALNALRLHYASHESIAKLGGAEIVGDHPWRDAIESRLCEFFQDLGNCPIDSWTGAANAINNLSRLSKGSTSSALPGLYAGFPAICIGAGPSATPEKLKEIAALSRTHVVFVADCMLDACRKAGFDPHYVCMLERLPETVEFVQNVNPKATGLICTTVVSNASVERFDRVCFWWSADAICTWLDPSQTQHNLGRSCGTLSIAAALLSGCSPVYLVGHDLSYGPNTATHCPGTHEIAVGYQRVSETRPRNPGEYCRELVSLPGYSGEPVLSNGIWSTMLGDISHIVAEYPERVVLSAQDGRGAAIPGVSPGCLPEVDASSPTAPRLPPMIPSNVPATGRVESLLADLDRLISGPISAPLEPESLAIGRFVSPVNAALFRYVFRSVTSSLLCRLHLRAAEGEAVQIGCLRALKRAYVAVCNHMKASICPLN